MRRASLPDRPKSSYLVDRRSSALQLKVACVRGLTVAASYGRVWAGFDAPHTAVPQLFPQPIWKAAGKVGQIWKAELPCA
jgi:hypothetical protein